MAIRKFKPSSPDKSLGKIKGDTELARFGHLNRLIDDINNTPSIPDIRDLGFKPGSIGPKVSFRKASGSSPETNKDIIIPGLLEITRGTNGGGIYNIAVEESSNDFAPLNTSWSTSFINSDYTSWAPLWDVQNRSFDTWRNAITTPNDNNDAAPPQYVGMPVVMKFDDGEGTIRYFLIMFTEWGVVYFDNYGFAYDRWEIFPSVYFEKPNGETETVDKISDGVWLARANRRALYNSLNEDRSRVGASPKNTRWNSSYVDGRPGYSGFSDLSNLESRVYTDFTHALDYNVGVNILSTELIMHDLTTDLYYKFVFSGWTAENNGGGFAYTRTVIPQSVPVKFADGSVMTTAATSGGTSGPTIDAEGNVIIADTSNNTVAVGNGATHVIPNFSGMLMVNDHYDGRVELWIAGGGDGILVSYSNVGSGTPTNTLTIGSNGYEWTNNDNMTGPFTFTVVKTRNNS